MMAYPLSVKKLKYRGAISFFAYFTMAFQAQRHLLSLAADTGCTYRNLALNPLDQRGSVTAYPHATANVETRDESVFCARNVIDGLVCAAGHGVWPYQSWGIGARTDACLTLDFGREVEIDTMDVYLRADFPHGKLVMLRAGEGYVALGAVWLSQGKAIPLLHRTGALCHPAKGA